MSRFRGIALATCVVLTACSNSGESADTTLALRVSTADVPMVAQIDVAIAALEAELGGPQEFFEINATARLVNLFVALDGATAVQPWLFFDGELTAQDREPAQGGVLLASDIDFDPLTIFSQLQIELPSATIETFYIQGDGQGAVRYAALLTTSLGGAIEVELGTDGRILASEPLN